jgi:tetratricopeptide (TPR) repeat protein
VTDVRGPESLAARLTTARQELDAGHPDAVVSDLLDVLETFSNLESATWSVLGQAYERLGRGDAAAHAWTRAAGLYDATHASELSAGDAADIATALNSVGRFGHASRLARTVLGNAGPHVGLLRALAEASTQRGHVGEAVTARRRVAELLADADRFGEAGDELDLAVALAPDDVDLLVDAARAALDAGEAERAGLIAERASGLAPSEPRVIATLAELDRRAGRLDAALERLLQANALDSTDAWTTAVHARVLRDGGRAEEALGVLDGIESGDPPDPILLLVRAEIRLESGDQPGSLSDARALVAVRPSSARAHLLLGEALLARSPIVADATAVRSALASFTRAVELAPGLAAAHACRGDALMAIGRADDAIDAYERAVSMDPTDQARLHSLGKALREAGQPEEALAALERAFELGEDGEVLATMGQVLTELGSPDALAVLERAIALRPTAGAFASIANLMIAEGDAPRALEILDGALERFPGDPALLERRAIAHNVLEERDLALEDLDALDRSSPPDPRRLQMRAFILTQADRPEEALDALRAAARLLSSMEGEGSGAQLMQVHLDQAAVLTMLRREEDAELEMDRAVELAPEGQVAALLERGRLRYNTDDLDGADADFALAIDELGADDDTRSVRARAVAWRGEVARMEGRIEDALSLLDQALSLDPANAFALGTKGQLFVAQGRLDEAEDLLLRALDGSPEPWVFVELGELYRRQGRFEEALERLDVALGREPGDAYARATRGQVQRASGRYDDAIDDLLAAIGTVPYPWAIEELLLAVSAWPDPTKMQDVLHALEEMSETGKGTGTVVVARSEVLRLLGRASEAMATIDTHLAVEPDDVAGRAVRCALLVDLGRSAEAVELATALLEDNPGHTFVRQMRIRALADIDRHVEALDDVDHLLVADDRDSWARATRGGLLADIGRIDEAVPILEPLVRDELANAFAAGALGYCYSKLERWSDAAALLQTAVELDPDVAWYQQELGRALERAGRTTEAHEVYRHVLANVDDGTWADRNSLTAAGWCAFRLDRLTSAAALLGRSTPGDRELPEARLDLGLVLLASRRPRVALDEYEGAMDLLSKHADPARARAILVSARDDLLQARKEGRLDDHRDVAERVEAMLSEEISRYPAPV